MVREVCVRKLRGGRAALAVPRAVGGAGAWDVDGGVTATGVLSRQRGNLITISITLY